MALYRVERTDQVQPGEFVDAYVIASGTALARKKVSHLPGVTAKNVQAIKLDTRGPAGGALLLSAYFDEREPAPIDADADMSPLF